MLSSVRGSLETCQRLMLTRSLRLSDNARAREALRQCLPEPLRDATFSSVLRDDAATKRCLAQLLINLSDNVVESSAGNHQGI
jgi:CCR4-NOT transcription complex subunit 9